MGCGSMLLYWGLKSPHQPPKIKDWVGFTSACPFPEELVPLSREVPLRRRCPFKRRGQAVATETSEALGEAPGSEPGRSGGARGLGRVLGGRLGVLRVPWGTLRGQQGLRSCRGRGGGVVSVGTGVVLGFGGDMLPPHLGIRQRQPPGETWSPPPGASRRHQS